MLLVVLADRYEQLHEEMKSIHVVVNVQTDSDRGLGEIEDNI